jgi:hypothetical protein
MIPTGLQKVAASISLVLLAICINTSVNAQGRAIISPKRLLFDGRLRSQEISLANAGTDTIRYEINVVEMRMKLDGSFEQITEPDSGQLFASKHVKVFPRVVELAPHEAQVVRVRLTNTNKMIPGEYRSHININPIVAKPVLTDKLYSELHLKLIPVVGVSIPLIIRLGDYDGKLTITDLSVKMLDEKTVRLYGTFRRSGKMSVYGDLSIEHTSNSGVTSNAALAKGISIYTPNTERQFSIDLKDAVSGKYSNGILKLVFVTGVEERHVKVAEAELKL